LLLPDSPDKTTDLLCVEAVLQVHPLVAELMEAVEAAAEQ
jgi:hypothetical protein